MAAEQKAVESTVEEILQREEHLVVTGHADLSVRVARESHSEKENHSVRDHSVKDQREEASEKVVREDHHSERERASVTDHAGLSARAAKDVLSVKDLREDHSVRVLKEDHSETESHLVKESHSETDRQETSEKVVREDHQEASATESQVDSE